jgi:hypothetical protein
LMTFSEVVGENFSLLCRISGQGETFILCQAILPLVQI